MIRLVLGAALGYVLGARAGRQRYDQIRRFGAAAADNPAVQNAAGFVRTKVGELLSGTRAR